MEDICEAIGTKWNGKLVGTFGDFACGSLYANKVVTAGDGGWVMAKDETRHDRLKSLVNHGFDPRYHFLHFETAPNAKMNGLGAALACASVAHIDRLNVHRHAMAGWYREHLKNTPVECMQKGQHDEPWVFGVMCKSKAEKDELRDWLASNFIETRNYFFPLHMQPSNFYQGTQTYEIHLPECEKLSAHGFYMPSHRYLEEPDVKYICAVASAFFEKKSNGSARDRSRSPRRLPACPREGEWVDRSKVA